MPEPPHSSAEEVERLRARLVQLEAELQAARDAYEQLQSESMLRSILENAPDIVILVDREARIAYINRVAASYTREAVLGQRIYDFVIPEHAALVTGAVERVFQTGRPEEYEVQDVVDRRWYFSRLAPVVESNRIEHVVVICVDIHDRKVQDADLRDSKAALEASEKTFRTLAQNIPGVVYLCRNDERYSMIFLNDAVEALVGIPASEFLADRVSFVDLYHPDDAMVIPPTVNAAVARRAPYHLTYRLRRVDGSYIWAEEYGQGVFDDEGRLKFLEGTVFDITTKRAAVEALQRSRALLEEQVEARTQQLRMANRLLRSDYQRQLDLTREVRQSEERFRLVCEATPVPVTISRVSDGQIIYANARAAQVTGLPLNELIGRKTIDFYCDPEEREIIARLLGRKALVQDYELCVRRPDGKIFWASVSMQALELDGVPCTLGILVDITERKLYAERANSERRMLRRLLELNERDRQLIAYEIHDGFVQDVTGAIMHLQASERRMPPDGAAQRDLSKGVDILRSAIDEARRLIDGLQPGVLEKQGVVEGVRYLAQQTERMHGIAVALDIDVRFDRLAPTVEQAIYRIVQEGLSNVVKHSKSPRARVVLSQRVDALVIKVEDTGVGFDPQTTKARRYGLTGIRDRARLLGGKAKIRSQPGQGTQVRVKLPLEDVLLPDGWQQAGLGDDDSSSGFTAHVDDSV